MDTHLNGVVTGRLLNSAQRQAVDLDRQLLCLSLEVGASQARSIRLSNTFKTFPHDNVHDILTFQSISISVRSSSRIEYKLQRVG